MQLLFFGNIKEAIRADSLEWNNSTPDLLQLKSALEARYDFLRDQPYAFAVNEVLIRNLDHQLDPNDTIALLPPYSGG